MKLELFWFGMRDYRHQRPTGISELARLYGTLFPDLRKQVENFQGFTRLKPHNYIASADTERALANNILNTEVDIVLESSSHLFIGEAKHESGLGANGGDVLVHQLVRQYVMAKILLQLTKSQRKIVPFVVSSATNLLRTDQVQFMLKQGWLREENVLTWGDIEALW